eukprot:TRINITY_DN43584_c0_g1_i1.p1 TRINITY_DN43584_c0_g1~~TRINITY_DN43584_c0_g1_i1.p1  ORF type:complete len:601 (-),score=41.19 TRINITY_DN43584_c0_g1_i1:306-2108(-)
MSSKVRFVICCNSCRPMVVPFDPQLRVSDLVAEVCSRFQRKGMRVPRLEDAILSWEGNELWGRDRLSEALSPKSNLHLHLISTRTDNVSERSERSSARRASRIRSRSRPCSCAATSVVSSGSSGDYSYYSGHSASAHSQETVSSSSTRSARKITPPPQKTHVRDNSSNAGTAVANVVPQTPSQLAKTRTKQNVASAEYRSRVQQRLLAEASMVDQARPQPASTARPRSQQLADYPGGMILRTRSGQEVLLPQGFDRSPPRRESSLQHGAITNPRMPRSLRPQNGNVVRQQVSAETFGRLPVTPVPREHDSHLTVPSSPNTISRSAVSPTDHASRFAWVCLGDGVAIPCVRHDDCESMKELSSLAHSLMSRVTGFEKVQHLDDENNRPDVLNAILSTPLGRIAAYDEIFYTVAKHNGESLSVGVARTKKLRSRAAMLALAVGVVASTPRRHSPLDWEPPLFSALVREASQQRGDTDVSVSPNPASPGPCHNEQHAPIVATASHRGPTAAEADEPIDQLLENAIEMATSDQRVRRVRLDAQASRRMLRHNMARKRGGTSAVTRDVNHEGSLPRGRSYSCHQEGKTHSETGSEDWGPEWRGHL